MSKSKFFDKMNAIVLSNSSDKERMVEDVYSEGISFYFSGVNIEHPFKCDGYFDTKTDNGNMLKLIMEYKYDEDMKSRIVRARIVLQVLFYLKKFEQNGMILPNVVMIGDVNECFVFHVNDIMNYLDENINWNIAPSNAASKNPDLVLKISNDENLNPFIFVIDENFSFKDVANKIKELADNVQRYVHVTEHNIATIYEYFVNRVIKNKKKISANDIVGVFIGTITNSEDYYLHPVKKNKLVTPLGDIEVDGAQFAAFFKYFARKYTPQEKMKFAEISDRLIEDTNRRNKGEFYTPTLFVDYAHKMIEEALGENWKDEYVVWDNCCGTKNLTRDYKFKELYCSTLENAELEISKKYNPEATSFQFDFLNDDLEKLPAGLLKAFEENKKIVFFLNPPYAKNSGNNDLYNSTSSTVCKTNIKDRMTNMKEASSNLYCQFMFRILEIKKQFNCTNLYVSLFSPTLFLTGQGYSNFRKDFLNNFYFVNACQFRASHFADVSDSWGISFSIWGSGETVDKNNFNYNLIDEQNGAIEIIGQKTVYNIDNDKTSSVWVREEVKNLKTFDCPNLTSGINIRTIDGTRSGKCCNNHLGYFNNGGNNVDKNIQQVGLYSSAYSGAIGASIIKENFNKVVSLFSARKLIEKNWINSKDEYIAPNESHQNFLEYVNDSIIFSLFHSSSNQSSLRNISYRDKLWNIKNEFFWMSREEIMNLTSENYLDDTYQDAYTSEERFVYNKLETLELSPEAQAVLDKATELVKKSFKYRQIFNEEHPEYQIMNWDCGWYQVKGLLKEYMKDDLKDFQVLYKTLADKMRPMVYELGFLKK